MCQRISVLSTTMNACIVIFFLLAFFTCSFEQNYNVTEVPAVCRSDWITVGTLCYYVGKTESSWNEALKHCEKQGARLAEPASHDDNQRLRLSMFDKGCSHGLWLGMRRVNDKKLYFQSNNESVTYSSMLPFQHDRGNESCIVMKCLGWLHYQCSKKIKFICEMQAEAPTTPSVTTTTISTTSTTTIATSTTTRSRPTELSSIVSEDETEAVMTTILLPRDQDAESGGNLPLLCTPVVILLQVVLGFFV